jgi:capsular exopolysaccharide synthesis family protein
VLDPESGVGPESPAEFHPLPGGAVEPLAARPANVLLEPLPDVYADALPNLFSEVTPKMPDPRLDLLPNLDPEPGPDLIPDLIQDLAADVAGARERPVYGHDLSPVLAAATPLLAGPTATAAAAPALAPTLHPVNLDTIASCGWAPLLAQLPAVQERGRTVEQFRSLRSRMQEFRGANRLKSILVSSGLPQEGKSFIAVNLAISLARHKISRVLLIDGDMRRSSLHRILGCPNDGPGLTEYLSGQASLQQIMKRPEPDPAGAPLPLGFSSLVFIAAGSEADKAADLSGNHRFGQLISTLSPLFDWVIVDSSPVNLVSDGVNLARHCDGVLLIARGGITKLETAQRAVAALEASKVLGVVLNAVNNSFASGGYYDYDSSARS